MALIVVFWPWSRAQGQATAQVRGEFRAPLMSQGRQIGLLTGHGADLQGDGSIRLRTARVEYADAGGNTNANVIVLATNCVADLKRNVVVWSPDGLSLTTADNQFSLAGTGFLWSQTNNELVVSNRVRTEVRKPPRTEGDANPLTLTITSDRFRFNYVSNAVAYRGGVRAHDPEMDVECERLDVRRSATGKFDHILAQDAVRITSQRDGSVTSAGRAEYTLSDQGELMDLTGEPRWRDQTREARAARFLFLRTHGPEPQLLQAIGQAWIRLPAGTNDLTLWPLASPAAVPGSATSEPPMAPEPPTSTGLDQPASRQIELSSEWIAFVLPPTNGPVRGLVAETNVMIASRHDGWQAAAQRATLTNAVLELEGMPVWTQGDRSIRGDRLRLDTRDRSFAADGHARIRFRAADFGATLPGPHDTNSNSTPGIRTNLFVTISSDRAQFQDGVLRFAPPVQGELTEGEFVVGRLQCRDLTVTYRSRLERLAAEGEVRFEQFFRTGSPIRTRWLECARLTVDFDASGRARALAADGGVGGRQEEVRPPAPELLVTTVQASRLDATFLARTNQLEHATAEGSLRIQRGPRVGEGEHAEFSGATGLLTITGRPVVTAPEGRIQDARVLIWDSRTGKVRGQGPFRIEWLKVPTNKVSRALAPAPKP